MNNDPIKRFTLLVLFQAQQDRATELAVSPTAETRGPIRYKIEGRWYDMSPPPPHILPELVAELGRMADFTRGPFPKEGIIDVSFSGIRLRWVARMASPESGVVLTPIEY